MSNQRTNGTCGSATHAGLEDRAYVLTNLRDGRRVFWTGDFTPKGVALSSAPRKAMIFDSVYDAYNAANDFRLTEARRKALSWFRVAPLHPRTNDDGFKWGWWHECH